MPQASLLENSCMKNPRKKKKFFFLLKLKGLGCKCTSLPFVSAPQTINSTADLENKRRQKMKKKMKRRPMQVRRQPRNVVIDVPDICCAPPGIGIKASDVAPRNRNSMARTNERTITYLVRRNIDDPVPDITEVLSRNARSRVNHHCSAEQIIEMLMLQQDLVSARIIRGYDRYYDWRLNVDDMTYEELEDLSDKIGYVNTGLRDEEIFSCIRISTHLNTFSDTDYNGDWKCSICQESYRSTDNIGTLKCGHNHHLQCLKKWLYQKNECPVCKSAALSKS